MDSYDYLPDKNITPRGPLSNYFLKLGIDSFKEACLHVHNMPYGYNTNYEDPFILFKEGKGTCTSKHAVIAGLAEELEIPLYKCVGIYKFTEDIAEGAQKIMEKYGIPFIPMVHCFLVYEPNEKDGSADGSKKVFRFDLTEGNINGKKGPIEEFIHTQKVKPFISRKDEYLLFKRVLEEKILPLPECSGIPKVNFLKARSEAIELLKQNIEKQKRALGLVE